jgi:hypothetical protein
MLPLDVARCAGRFVAGAPATAGSGAVSISFGHVECMQCRRRTDPGHPERQVHMEKPEFIGGKCPERIGPRERQ